MNCETKKRGKLCRREECKPCFERSFASNEKSKYLAEGQGDPLLIARSSHKKFWFDCEKCKHSFETTPNKISIARFCPFCSNKKLCSSDDCKICFEKSFASHKRAEFWDFEKNEHIPRKLFAGSGKKFWFGCKTCGHSFESTLNNITSGHFCPFCSNDKLCCSGDCKICFEKSFASHKKAEFWDFEKNKQKPNKEFKSSGKKFWFRCEKGHGFNGALYSISSGGWCPKCKNKTEAKLLSFFEKHFEEPIYQFKTSWCKNPETNKFLPFDFCVSKTIIELDGRQHYEQVSNWRTPEEQQKLDRYKEKCAIKNGYSVLRILQKDVYGNKMDWEASLLEHVKDYKPPVIKRLWDHVG
ncbi:restriction endonuclease [Cannes 8 virus]|nr:restriction endonuclease [Cannes 8 virus]AVR52748.1 restriction endonuclease [Marseillevirus Shanghai 1]